MVAVIIIGTVCHHVAGCCTSCSTGLDLYTRLQNGVDRVPCLVRVNESLGITNHRGACQPHRHEHHNKQIQYGCRQPCWRSPQFSAHICCGQTAGCIKMPFGTDVGLTLGDFVLDGDPVPLAKKGRSPPKNSADVYCGQTAGWIKIPLGTKVCLSPCDSVFDGDPAPLLTKGVEPPPQFSAHFYCGQTAGCIKMPLGMEASAQGICV